MAKRKSDSTGQKPISDWLSYVAGYIDGEGCFSFNRSPEVSVTNTFPYTLRKLAEMFGGVVRTRTQPDGREYFQWRIYGDNAIDFIHQVRPYLWEKLPQADLVLRIRDTEPGPQRDGLRAQLKQLKRLNYD